MRIDRFAVGMMRLPLAFWWWGTWKDIFLIEVKLIILSAISSLKYFRFSSLLPSLCKPNMSLSAVSPFWLQPSLCGLHNLFLDHTFLAHAVSKFRSHYRTIFQKRWNSYCLSKIFKNQELHFHQSSVLLRFCTLSENHCVKYSNFILFPSVEILWKDTVSAEFPHQEINWDYGILSSVWSWLTYLVTPSSR